MSRFADTLRKALVVTPPAMGFRRYAPTSKTRMALVARLMAADAEGGALARGADAALLDPSVSLTAKALKTLAKGLGDMPWGAWVESGGQALKPLEAAGADFIAFAPDKMGLETSDFDGLGKELVIEPSQDSITIRAANELPVEAVLLKHDSSVFTWDDLIHLRYFSDTLVKPFLVTVPADITSTALKALWGAGVDAVVVTASEAGQMQEFAARLAGVEFPTRRKWTRAQPIVPVIRPAPPAEEKEEEEEGEEVEEPEP